MYLFNFKPFPYNNLIISEKSTKLEMKMYLSTGPTISNKQINLENDLQSGPLICPAQINVQNVKRVAQIPQRTWRTLSGM